MSSRKSWYQRSGLTELNFTLVWFGLAWLTSWEPSDDADVLRYPMILNYDMWRYHERMVSHVIGIPKISSRPMWTARIESRTRTDISP